MIIILFLFSLLIVFLVALVFHELGHYLYFKLILKKNIKINYYFSRSIFDVRIEAGRTQDYLNLDNLEYLNVNIWGVLLGAILLGAISLVAPIVAVLFIPYFIGCDPDIKEIIKVVKYERNKRNNRRN